MDKLDTIINGVPKNDELFLDDELLNSKLAYTYEYFIVDTLRDSGTRCASGTQSASGSFQEPLNLTKEGFWSTLKQETPPDEEINRNEKLLKI